MSIRIEHNQTNVIYCFWQIIHLLTHNIFSENIFHETVIITNCYNYIVIKIRRIIYIFVIIHGDLIKNEYYILIIIYILYLKQRTNDFFVMKLLCIFVCFW